MAAKTIATPAETWAIVIVAVICLAFWLVMVVAIAPRPDARKRQRQALQAPFAGATPVPVSGGMHAAPGGRSVAPSRDAPAMEMPAPVEVPGGEVAAAEPEGTRETRDDLPTVPGQRRAGQTAEPAGSSPLDLGPRMPAQREPAADQATPGRRPER